jgi:hypothetical protein
MKVQSYLDGKNVMKRCIKVDGKRIESFFDEQFELTFKAAKTCVLTLAPKFFISMG